ncbi:hypothetical protein Trydic_g3582 [Trypoxylus dichotomus]
MNNITNVGGINCSVYYCSDVRSHTEKARISFVRVRKLLCGRDMSLDLRTWMLKCYGSLVYLYGVETRTLNVYYERKLEAFEMLEVPWTVHDNTMDSPCGQRGGSEKNGERRGDPTRNEKKVVAVSRHERH